MSNIVEKIKKIFGEQNLYKIDPYKYPDKPCKHNKTVFCDKCREVILVEKNGCKEEE